MCPHLNKGVFKKMKTFLIIIAVCLVILKWKIVIKMFKDTFGKYISPPIDKNKSK